MASCPLARVEGQGGARIALLGLLLWEALTAEPGGPGGRGGDSETGEWEVPGCTQQTGAEPGLGH